MPRTIHLPQSPWSQMLPQMVSSMAMAKFAQSLKPEVLPEAPKNIPGKEKQWLWDAKKGEFTKSKIPVPERTETGPKYEGLTIYGKPSHLFLETADADSKVK